MPEDEEEGRGFRGIRGRREWRDWREMGVREGVSGRVERGRDQGAQASGCVESGKG